MTGGLKGGAFRAATRGFWGIGVGSVRVSFPVAAILFLLTFLLGVPTAGWWAVRIIRKPLAATLGIYLTVVTGILGPFGGPFGLPFALVAGISSVFCVTFTYAFLTVCVNAWSAALQRAALDSQKHLPYFDR